MPEGERPSQPALALTIRPVSPAHPTGELPPAADASRSNAGQTTLPDGDPQLVSIKSNDRALRPEAEVPLTLEGGPDFRTRRAGVHDQPASQCTGVPCPRATIATVALGNGLIRRHRRRSDESQALLVIVALGGNYPESRIGGRAISRQEVRPW